MHQEFAGLPSDQVWTALVAVAQSPSYDDWTVTDNDVWVDEAARRIEIYRRLRRVIQQPAYKARRENREWRFQVIFEPTDPPQATFTSRGLGVPSHADTIEAVRYRAVVLGRIALTQAEAGNIEEADLTLEMALAAISKIKLPYALSYAISRVSLSMAGIGKVPKARSGAPEIFAKAVKTAAGIDDNRLRAHTLWNIAAEQVRAGFSEQAEGTRNKAEKATGEIKSTLSRVWMFSEITNVHATEGEDAAAWAAFDHGHRVAQEIDNPWGRARAFGKLASTLIKLVNPGKISP